MPPGRIPPKLHGPKAFRLHAAPPNRVSGGSPNDISQFGRPLTFSGYARSMVDQV